MVAGTREERREERRCWFYVRRFTISRLRRRANTPPGTHLRRSHTVAVAGSCCAPIVAQLFK
jgi:hypothetical protein